MTHLIILYIIITYFYMGLCEVNDGSPFPLGPINNTIPFVVSIQTYAGGIYESTCVGTLVAYDVVLTSSECIGADIHHLSVACNGYYMSTDDKMHRHNVIDIALSNSFVGLVSDKVALLKIYPPIAHTAFSLPKYLYDYTDYFIQDLDVGVILGWPHLNTYEGKLIESTPFRKLSSWSCAANNIINVQEVWHYARKKQFCGQAIGDRGACRGETGAALFNRDLTVIYGVLQKGVVNCSRGEPYIFTDIRNIAKWINEMLMKWSAMTYLEFPTGYP